MIPSATVNVKEAVCFLGSLYRGNTRVEKLPLTEHSSSRAVSNVGGHRPTRQVDPAYVETNQTEGEVVIVCYRF